MNEPNPLGPEHLRLIDSALGKLSGLDSLVAKCQACGMPIDDVESDRQHLIAQLSQIKQQFFPPSH